MRTRFRWLPLLVLGCMLASAMPAEASAARVVSNGPRSRPLVALTFDDGNSPASASAILATLQANGVPATFFPYANAMRADPAVWHRIAAAGYPIGNHSVSHPQLTLLSDAALAYEVGGATALITTLSGRAPISVMRPPYGSYDARVAAAAAAAGYPTLMLWDVDPRDWSGIAAATITARVLAAARDGSVILLHVGPNHTPQALPFIIAGLRARGFGFIIPQLLGGGRVVGTHGYPAPLPPPPAPEPRLMSVRSPERPASSRSLGHPILLVPPPALHFGHRLSLG